MLNLTNLNVQNIVSSSNANININPDGTGNVLIGNYTFDADQTVGAGQDNYLMTYDDSTGLVSLEEPARVEQGFSKEIMETLAIQQMVKAIFLEPTSKN